jgi:hypothetical protein
MSSDFIRGKTIRFTFADGPMAKKTFEHVFHDEGVVSFRMIGGEASSAAVAKETAGAERKPEIRYEAAMVREGVWAVSYLSSAGYTLTTILDFETRKLVAFSSNEKMLAVQHGTFEVAAAPVAAATNSRNGRGAHASRH